MHILSSRAFMFWGVYSSIEALEDLTNMQVPFAHTSFVEVSMFYRCFFFSGTQMYQYLLHSHVVAPPATVGQPMS